jgi:hypothetical protein
MDRLIVPLLFGWVVITVGLSAASFSDGREAGRADLRTEAIERGYGLHCPTNGRFAWRGECEESE